MLMMHLWESDSFIDDNTLTVNVTRLRKNWRRQDLQTLSRRKRVSAT